MVTLIDSLNPLALYAALPFAFILIFFRYNVLSTNKSMLIISLVYLWVCICYPFAGDYQVANNEMKRILGSFILCYIVAGMAKHENNIPYLYVIPIILLIAAWIYAKNNILVFFDYGEQRLNDSKLNANMLAYYTFYLTIALYLYGEILTGKLKGLLRILFFLIIPISFFSAIYTGSRQVLIIQIPLIGMLLLNRYNIKSLKNRIIFISVLIVALLGFAKYGESIYNDSMLKQRNEIAIQDDTRMDIIEECIHLSLKKPLFGYGPGNSVKNISTGHFAHNTFLELLVNTGVIGMILFLWLVFSFARTQYKRWRQTKDNLFLVFIIFILFWFIDQMFYVFYIDLWLMAFFVIVSSHSDTYYRNNYRFTCRYK